ncbi:acetyltransferase (GNAT) family protein [Mucilaginibacter yixingensis]|uniref:Acetyltransferase (GNAT) family protein n=1 Tax=Mucilaginibacter yixingensis TaxID=1295612 RepID=A0A2T5J9B9_9SPHI|nr:GNAT family N-acetyltransferase [Mucilaginibacter yixingensis]PTQ96668.1 acetyltransferase (GNAT) family protein [Mucilaginibacter yixingensis]
MTKVLYIQDKLEWNAYVSKAAEYDFCQTWHYHALDTTGTALLFIYENNEGFIGLPLIKRPIPDTVYYDLTSVYGYTGPISNFAMPLVPHSLITEFKSAFIKFLDDGNFISVFSRLNPFYEQTNIFRQFGGLHDNGLSVAIDLSIDDETRRKNYPKNTLQKIRQARNRGYLVKDEKNPQAAEIFTIIYHENMNLVGASKSYMFDESHIHKLLHTDEYDARILLVYDGDKPIAATFITFTNGIIQGYLIATLNEYRRYSPSKLITDSVCVLGKQLGMKYYNLGGGRGFKQDSLFNWKAEFSDLFLPYYTWRYIANPAVYNTLLYEQGIDENADIDFFPLYRSAQMCEHLYVK